MKQTCTACSQQGHNRRACPLVYGPKRKYQTPVHRRHGETRAMLADLQLCFDFTYPKAAGEAFAELRDQWGSIGERRLQRMLRRLEAERRVIAVGVRYADGFRCGSDGYIRARTETVNKNRSARL